jgi:hypothetical protein
MTINAEEYPREASAARLRSSQLLFVWPWEHRLYGSGSGTAFPRSYLVIEVPGAIPAPGRAVR